MNREPRTDEGFKSPGGCGVRHRIAIPTLPDWRRAVELELEFVLLFVWVSVSGGHLWRLGGAISINLHKLWGAGCKKKKKVRTLNFTVILARARGQLENPRIMYPCMI